MFEFLSPLTFLLLGNSIVTIGLILNQNESTKDSMNTQNSNSSANPLEIITWICLVFQIFLLLFKIKVSEL
jgi:hypothetical protein